MNVNDKLTEAARRGARGHEGFRSLPLDKQEDLIHSVLEDKEMTMEAIRASLSTMSAAEIEEMLNAMGETRDDEAKQQQQLHTGAD